MSNNSKDFIVYISSEDRGSAKLVGPILLVLTLIGASAAWGQQAPRNVIGSRDAGTYPRLPGAVTRPPAWLGSEAPFDVARFFATPPRSRNAAPLYLDALFEFGSELADCFPDGPDRDRRRQAAVDRSKRFKELMDPIYNKAEADVPAAVADEIVRLYEAGLKKLRDAQQRDQCVFETSFSALALLPHAQVARQVVRVVTIRAQQAVARGDIEAAIGDVDLVLRLARDLQPRGTRVTQLVAAAVQGVVGIVMVPPILSSPKLRTHDCDSLIKVLVTHDQRSIDGYAEGLRAECIVERATLRDLVLHQRELAAGLKLKPGEPLVRTLLRTVNPGREVGDLVPDDVDARLARTTPAELARRERDVDRFYRTALASGGGPVADALKKIPAIQKIAGRDPLAVVVATLVTPQTLEPLMRTTSRATATSRATLCLVSLRRWQLTHRGLPRSLLVAIKDAGLKSVPIDPYDGKPLRLVMLGGEPVVYSVGRDGKDDGGQKDSNKDLQAGDLLYKLPPIAERPRIRPAHYRGKPATSAANPST